MLHNLEINRDSEEDWHLYDSGSKKLNLLYFIRNLEHRQCKRIFTNLYKISIISIYRKN